MKKNVVFGAAALLIFTHAHAEKTDLQLTGTQGVHMFFTVSSPWSENQKYLEGVLRGACYGKPVCFSHVWKKGDAAPRKFPLSDKAVATELATFQQNKHTGLNKLLWSCKRFHVTDKTKCF